MNDQAPSNRNPVSTRSSGVRTILASLLLILSFPYKSPAPFYGQFPGLSNLLEHADAVVVADILEKPMTMSYGGGGVFKIWIRKVLKGEAEEGRTYSACLRALEFQTTQSNSYKSLFPEALMPGTEGVFLQVQTTQSNSNESLFPEGMKPGAEGVFFLVKSDRAKPKVEFWSEDCEGDAFSISPNADLKKLPGLKPREAVVLLLKDASAYYGERFPGYKAAISKMLASP